MLVKTLGLALLFGSIAALVYALWIRPEEDEEDAE